MFPQRRRLFYLKVLVLLSMAGSLLSAYTKSQGWGEVYPFNNWKLFTQPRGHKSEVSFYRIYLRAEGDTAFIRQNVKPIRSFTQDEYVYTLDFLVGEALLDSTAQWSAKKEKLRDFARHLYPGAAAYSIVQETHDLRQSGPAEIPGDTSTVLQFPAK